MPVVDIKGVGKAQFPDKMPINDIKTFLRNKYYQDVAQGNSRALDPQPQTATNVNPSLIETAGQKVSDYLFDQGIISDRYRAQEVGKSIAGLGEFLPVLGDATAGDDFGKAAAQGDKLGMGLGLLGAVPVLGDVAKKAIKSTNNSVDDLASSKIKVYHGTDDADFEDFDLSMTGDSTFGTFSQEGGEAIYTASDIEHAKNYGKYIKELEVDTKDYYKLDMNQELKDVYDMYESYQDAPFDDWLDNLEDSDNLFEVLNFDDLIGNEIKRQKKKGYKGIVADFSKTNFSDIVTPFDNETLKQIKTIKRGAQGDKYYD